MSFHQQVVIGVGRTGFPSPLPPNRTCRSPASGSPVGGLTHEGTGDWRHGSPAVEVAHEPRLQLYEQGHPSPSRASPRTSEGHQQPCYRGRRSGHRTFRSRAWPAVCSPFRQCYRAESIPFLALRLHLPAPLRSTGITRLHRYYGCSDSCARPGLWLTQPGTQSLQATRRSLRFTYPAFEALCPQPPHRSQ